MYTRVNIGIFNLLKRVNIYTKNEAQDVEINRNKETSEIKSITESKSTDEKIVTLDGVFKSSKKPVAFKKRNTDSAQQNLRKKTNN